MKQADAAEKEIVFASARWPWLVLVALTGLAAPLALGGLALVVAYGPATDVLAIAAIAAGLLFLLGLGAWRAARGRREVALDAEGLTVRRPNGVVLTRLSWADVTAITRRRVLTHDPYLHEVVLRRRSGQAVVIDSWMMGDTERLAREARRLHERAGQRAE